MILKTLTAAAVFAAAVAAAPADASAAGRTIGQPAMVAHVAAHSRLNVRAKPALHGRVIGAIPAGGRPFVHRCVRGHGGHWCRVSYRGCTGWASARFLALW